MDTATDLSGGSLSDSSELQATTEAATYAGRGILVRGSGGARECLELDARIRNCVSVASRAQTFDGKWSRKSHVDPAALAKAGFIYTGPGLAVQCVSCGVKIEKWLEGESALGTHLVLSPCCPFVVQVSDSLNEDVVSTSTTEDNTESHDDRLLDPPAAETEEQMLHRENQALKASRLCKVCRTEDSNIVLLPCGHIATCSGCARVDTCPVCRRSVEATVHVYRT